VEILEVSEVLAHHGLRQPELDVLVGDERNYRVWLMQPEGVIEATTAAVRNRDRELAQRQYAAFLQAASQRAVSLVLTPEYSMPWEVLSQSIQNGILPADGSLWVLGCESILLSELAAFQSGLSTAATVVFEDVSAAAARFLDPLAYVFVAPASAEEAHRKVVVLVQFKTFPMGDNDHFEINNMHPGKAIYRFGTAGRTLCLLTLICSDALDFNDALAARTYDRALILHLQLNQKPRHEMFRRYRDRLMELDGDTTEVICLNWAAGMRVWSNGVEVPWNNIAGSAWYLRPATFDQRDETLAANHRKGLYYTWQHSNRAHALFFNYQPGIFVLDATKVAHIAVSAVVAKRRGPQLVTSLCWDPVAGNWIERDGLDDGFSAIAHNSGGARSELLRLARENPFAAERALALTAGKVATDSWHNVRHLDSCCIDSSEIIQRITFCQDTDSAAQEFRIARLKRCGHLWDILTRQEKLPPALTDLSGGVQLAWTFQSPHQNVLSRTGDRATAVYMGEECDSAHAVATATRLAEFLHRQFRNPDDSHNARQRLAVWYRDGDDIVLVDSSQYLRFDRSGTASELDYARDS
jgi:hypothetical protein